MKTKPNHKTILLIDSDKSNRTLLKYLFEKQAEIVCIDPTLDAINALRIEPDLIFLEFYQGKCNFELIEAVIGLQLKAPLVALTACAMNNEREKSLRLGCDYYIHKPINIKAFTRFTSKLLNPTHFCQTVQ